MSIYIKNLMDNRTFRLLLSIILITGIAIPTNALMGAKAWAGTVPVSVIEHEKVTPENNILIAAPGDLPTVTGIEDATVQKSTVEGIDGTVITDNYIVGAVAGEASGLTGPNRNICRADINLFRQYILDSLALDWQNNLGGSAYNASGHTIEFPNLTNSGDVGSVQVTYPLVGAMQGKAVGAKVTYKVTATGVPGKNSYTTYNYSYPVIQVGDSFHSGCSQHNVESMEVDVSFFYTDGSVAPMEDGAFFTINSLNAYDADQHTMENPDDVVFSEAYCVTEGLQKYEYVEDGNGCVVTANDNRQWATTTSQAGWVDNITDPSFYKNSVSAYVAGQSAKFIIGPHYFKQSNSIDKNAELWWCFSTVSLGTPVKTPVKSVSETDVKPGDNVHWAIEQSVGIDMGDTIGKYNQFSITDKIPDGVSYTKDSAKVYTIINGVKTDVTNSQGQIQYDDNSKTLKWEANATALENMLMRGEIYRLEFTTTVDDTPAGLNIIPNEGTVFINNSSIQTNRVPVIVNLAELTLEKSSSKYEWQVGDDVDYTIIVKNIADGSIANNVNISDVSLPDGLKMTGEAIMTGVPTSVDYPVVIDGQVTTETRDNTSQISSEGNGWKAQIKYLPANTLISITLHCKATKAVNGTEVVNTATATADNYCDDQNNPIVVKDAETVWINSPMLDLTKVADKYEYQVGEPINYTLETSNVFAGTIAKDVTITDTSLPDGVVLDKDSIKVEGIPETVDYNVDGNGETGKTEPVENNVVIEKTDNGFVVRADYLPAGIPVTVTYTATPTEEVNGFEIINRAQVNASNGIEGWDGSEADEIIWINTPHMAIDKVVKHDKTEVDLGDTVTYRITVDNNQIGTLARNIVIADDFTKEGIELDRSSIIVADDNGDILDNVKIETNLNNQSFTITTGDNLACSKDNYSVIDGANIDKQETLIPTQETYQTQYIVEFQATVTDSELVGTTLTNKATATADNADPVEDTAEVTIKSGKPQIDKNIISIDEQAKTATYEITVANAGSGELSDYELNDIATNMTYKESDGNYEDGVFAIPTLAAGEKYIITATYDITDMSKEITNYVLPANPDENYDLSKVRVTSAEDMTPAANLLKVGDTIYYQVVVTNTGDDVLASQTVTDKPIEGLALTDAISVDGTATLNDDGTVTWNTKALESKDDTATMVVTGTVVSAEATNLGDVTNKAYTDDHIVIVTDPLPGGELSVIKTCDPKSGSTVKSGDEITYTLNITNNSNSEVKGLGLFDAIPENTTYIDNSADNNGKLNDDKSGIGWLVEKVAPGETTTVNFKVKVNDGVPNGTVIENFATYAPDQTDTPTKPLEKSTNKVEHKVVTPENPTTPENPVIPYNPVTPENPVGSLFDTTGNMLAQYGWILLLLGLGAAAGITYGIRSRRHYTENDSFYDDFGDE